MPHRSFINNGSLVAERNVPLAVSQDQIQNEIPYNWKDDDVLGGYVNKYKIVASGADFISPPYKAYWNRILGACHLPKYKDIFTNLPRITAYARAEFWKFLALFHENKSLHDFLLT